jgi:AraC-like DNA-binding protein
MLLQREAFRRLCQARDLLAGDEEPAPSVEEVARRVAISPFHFMRQFEAVFGETPHQFRIGRRLERAKQLLARGQHSVTEVCMEVGFSSLGSFSELFTRRVGESPSRYRRRLARARQLR